MLVDDYLRMSSACLKPLQEWSHASEGLPFVFPTGGAGRHVSGTASRLLAPGDVLAVNGASDGKLVAANGGEFVFTSFSAHSEALLPLFASNEVSLLGPFKKNFRPAPALSRR